MTAETKVVSQMSEEVDTSAGVVEQKTDKETGLETTLPIDMVQDVNEVSHPFVKASVDLDEDNARSNNDERVDPASGMSGVRVGGGDPDQQSYVFVDSHNGGGGDSSSDWDLNVEEDDVDASVVQAETEVDNVGGDVIETHLPAQSRKDIIPSSDVVLLSPSEEENQSQKATAVVVESENEQSPPSHPEEAAAAVTQVESENEQPEPPASVVTDLMKEQDQVETETSLLVLEVDNLKSTVTAAAAEKSRDALESSEQEEANSSESVLESDKDEVSQVVNPHDANDVIVLPVEEAQVVLVSEVSKTNAGTNDCMLGMENPDKETEVKLDSSNAESGAVVQGVKQEESLPKVAECTSLEVEVVESPTEVEEMPNARSPVTESCLLDKEEVEKLEREEGEETGFEVKLKEHEEGLSQLKVDGDRGIKDIDQEGCDEAAELFPGTNIVLEPETKLEHVLTDSNASCHTSKPEEQVAYSVAKDPSDCAVDQGIKDIVHDGCDEAAELFQGTDILLEPETKLEHVLTDSNACCPKPEEQVTYSVAEDPSDCAVEYAAAQNNNSSEDDNNLHLPDNSMKPETESINGTEAGNCNTCFVNNGVEVEVTTVSEEINEVSRAIKASDSSCTDINKEEASQAHVADDLDPVNGALVGDAGRNSAADVISNSEIHNSSSTNGMNISCIDAAVISQSPLQFGSFVPELLQVNSVTVANFNKITSQEPACLEQVHNSDVSKSPPLTGGFNSHPVVEHSVPVEVKSVERPFNFLIKMPRYYDDQLNEQIRQAELQVAEKMQKRDSIRYTLQMIKGNVQQAQSVYAATLSEERAARRSVRLKRQEIDSVQAVINRVKNAIFVKDIDVRIKNMEHMMQHETLPLKEEKQYIREIKQLKHHREQLSSNMGSQDEVQQALDEKDHIEEQLKILKKELDHLKNKVSTSEAIAVAAEKKLKDEKKRLQEVIAQHAAAHGLYQEARTDLQILRRQSSEKNSWFWTYKDDAKAAYEYASSGDKESIHRLCLNQVEKIMEAWNNDDEFRKEYLRCNTRSTMWRLKTMDGRALGPDEELPVVPSFTNERAKSWRYHKAQHQSNPGPPLAQDLERKEKSGITRTKEEAAAAEKEEGKSVEEVASVVLNNEKEKARKHGKPTIMTNSSSSPLDSSLLEEEEEKSDNNKQTKEEQEAARKEEQFRRAEEEAKLKEQRRLEEIAKAKEALERKKRIAEARASRAEARAQKEAEQKEKEKEKRAKKKEKKKAGDSISIEGGDIISEIVKDEAVAETTNTKQGPTLSVPPPTTQQGGANKRPQKAAYFKQQNKLKSAASIPPQLRNKNKRRMQQWIWIFVILVIVVAVFVLGNMGMGGIGFYTNPLSHNSHKGSPPSF